MPLRDPQTHQNGISEHADSGHGTKSDHLEHEELQLSASQTSEAVDQIAGELVKILAPLQAKQRRRAIGQLLARVEDNLEPQSEATHRASRRALGFGLTTVGVGLLLYLLARFAAPLAMVGQLVGFAGLVILLGPLSRLLSDFLSGSKR